MPGRARSLVLALAAAAAATGLSACGTRDIEVASDDQRAAHMFEMHCEACHTLDVVGAEGSASRVNDREYKDGPNFNQRKEERGDVLYAIRNGGFSSGPMPQDILVGRNAELVADFVAKYSGRDAGDKERAAAPTPNRQAPEGVAPGGEP